MVSVVFDQWIHQFLEWLYIGSERALGDDEGYQKGEGLCLSVCRESRCQFWWVFDHQKLVFRVSGYFCRRDTEEGGVE